MKDIDNFDSNVFLNCPFDPEFEPLRKAMVFTIIQCGFIVRSSDEDHTEKIRINKIIKIIDESKYGIHDLSRISLKEGEMPRNNMPLELGIFIGSQAYKHKSKDYLILDSKPHRYKEHTTDLGGQDPGIHNNDCATIINLVRNFLAPKKPKEEIPSGSFIYEKMMEFTKEATTFCLKYQLNFKQLTFSEYQKVVIKWLTYKRESIERKFPTKLIDVLDN